MLKALGTRYLTQDLPGVGGVIKQRPEDFLVEEVPAYEPAGEGEHLYLFIEKRQVSTTDVVRRLAKAFRVGRGEVGYAGLKDKQAITRQHFSVRLTQAGVDEQAGLANFEHYPNAHVLWTARHGNKLRLGHLTGNRFVIRLRDVQPTAVVRVKPILDRLEQQGVPNYVGEQRFGYRLNNHRAGRSLLLGDYEAVLVEMLGDPQENESERVRAGRAAFDRSDYAAALEQWPRHLRYDRQALDALRQGASAERAVAAIDAHQRAFLISALQSAMFNHVLTQRVQNQSFAQLLPGDLAWKHENGSVFAVDEPTAELENAPDGRVATMAISPSGPMWGLDMARADGEPGRIEEQVLESFVLKESDLAGHALAKAMGARRPLRIVMRDPDLSGGMDEHGAFVRLAFELPRGAFATTVLREVMKGEDQSAE